MALNFSFKSMSEAIFRQLSTPKGSQQLSNTPTVGSDSSAYGAELW